MSSRSRPPVEAVTPHSPRLSRTFLEDLYTRHHHPENLSPDPLEFALGFDDPLEGEVAGLLAAGLAYGRVRVIVRALSEVFAALGPRPRLALETLGPQGLSEALGGFSYRFHRGDDLAIFLHLVGQALARHGSLGRLFGTVDPGGPLGPALDAFAAELLAGDPRPLWPEPTLPLGHRARNLVPPPGQGGGAAKRLCLYLRWMVRRDALDPGYWHGQVDPGRLVVPLDTHVARVGRALGMTDRQSATWRTAGDITATLRRFDPADPVRYDFSLFRFGAAGDDSRPR